MQSKLLVNVQENGFPCITVIQPHVKPGLDFNLPDKVLQMFFEKMDPAARFCGVITDEMAFPDGRVHTIIPMDIPYVLEWLNRFFVEYKCNTSSQVDVVRDAFANLRALYYNENQPSSL